MPETSRKTIQNILVATDFSETARIGLAWGIELARAHRSAIRLVHGLLLANRMTDFVPSPPDFTASLQEAAAARLQEAAEPARAAGLEVSTDLILGLPSQVILEAAASDPADLVVIGTRGHTGLRHLLLGSTAERVVQRASCPVLTVHPGDGERRQRVRTILVPTDFSRDARLAGGAALDLLSPLAEGARVVLLHVYHLPFEYTAYGTIPTSFDYFKDVEGAAQERLDEAASGLRREGLAVKTLAREGYPPEVIVDAAEDMEADLIAMGTHGRSGLAHLLLGSTAERVVQRAHCPVLTVRRSDD